MAASRRRGVRASRIRLERALAEADLARPTQAALADRIADLESLDAAPKDMVSRVFRELPVDPQSIERVARAMGVAAHTLYLAGQDAEISAVAEPPRDAPIGPRPRPQARRAAWLIVGMVALTAIAIGALLQPSIQPADLVCRVQGLLHAARVPTDRLGVLIARFDDDADNRAQRYLADRFLEDAALKDFVSVVSLCDRYEDDAPGDRREHLNSIRAQAQRRLAERNGHLLLWGSRRGDVLHVRLVSTRTELSPQAVVLNDRPLYVDERYLELPVDTAHPDATLPELKKLTLELMQLDQDTVAARRDAAMAAYRGSSKWLKASVISDRHLRDSIEPEVDPTRWALVNAQLCYKYRLLGDLESSEAHHQAAVEACEAVLTVRPRREFPQEWAAVKTNLGSAWLRLHAYAGTVEAAVARLEHARAEIEAAAAVIERGASPQLWAVNRRTLGTIHLRIGQLTDAPESDREFELGIAALEDALALQRPDFQPLDWALTQQNICLAQYQRAARLGAAGIPLVREAVQRCRDAANRLTPSAAGLSWGMVQNNLAASIATLAQLTGDAAELERAAETFVEAQRVYTRERVPVNWAEVEVNLGELHCNLGLMRDDAGLIDRAAVHTAAALQVFIEHGVTRYQRHAEGLLVALDACDREDLASCRCAAP